MSKICRVTSRELPDSLAGYQCIENGALEEGDLAVLRWPEETWYVKHGVGLPIDVYMMKDGCRIYRKIPVANHKDSADDRTKALIAEQAAYFEAPISGPSDNDPTHMAAKAKPAWSDVASQFYTIPIDRDARKKAATHDEGKPPLAYLPWKALREVALVQLYGEQKYHDWFNYKAGMEVGRHASCAVRHIAEYMDGIDLDPESNRKHLAHAVCRLLFILENEAEGTAIDDRYRRPPERKC